MPTMQNISSLYHSHQLALPMIFISLSSFNPWYFSVSFFRVGLTFVEAIVVIFEHATIDLKSTHYAFVGVPGQAIVDSAMATEIESFTLASVNVLSLGFRSKITTLMASLQEAQFTITKPHSHSYALASLCSLSQDFNTEQLLFH
jgi:hypothetical protein